MKYVRKFGRIQEFDEGSKLYSVMAVPGLMEKPFKSRTWKCNVVLDQKDKPACVGFSFSSEAAATPVAVKNITNKTGLKVYSIAQTLDNILGENYEGTTVLAGAKAGVQMGWFESYRWAFDELDLALAIGYLGPVVLGINWYAEMSNPDSKGVIGVGGPNQGGHAIMLNGYDHKNKMYRLHNTWGSDWGVNGECFVSVKNMRKLLYNHGEAVIPISRSYGR